MFRILVLFILVKAVLDLRDFGLKNRKSLELIQLQKYPSKIELFVQHKIGQSKKRNPMNYENPLNRGLPVPLTSNSLERARLVTALKVGK